MMTFDADYDELPKVFEVVIAEDGAAERAERKRLMRSNIRALLRKQMGRVARRQSRDRHTGPHALN